MVQNVNPTFVKTPNRGVVQISTGTGTSVVTLYTGGVNGSKIVGINATTTSTTAFDLRLYLTNGGVNYFVSTGSLTALSGSVSTVPSVNLFALSIAPGLPIDSDGNPYLLLASSADSLSVQAGTTIPTTGGLAHVVAVSGDF